jgi:deoxyribodipyrimidine photo-lyase
LKISIHWFRRDFRLADNASLAAAAADDAQVVPVYILSQWKKKHHWTGANRQEFLCGCLRALAGDLEAIGGRLIIRSGEAVEELEKLLIETRAEAIHCQRDPDPFGRATEDKVAAMASRRGVAFQAHPGVAMHARDELLTGAGEPYRVYSPYARAW